MSTPFSSSDPYCIPRDQFCDGMSDCANGRDEQQIGFGFKCRVNNQQESCVLSPHMAFDAIKDCADGEDLVPQGKSLADKLEAE